MRKQELDSIADPYVLLLAGLEERQRVLRVEEENMQKFFYVQEKMVSNKIAASSQERDARRGLTSSFPGISSPSFPSGSTTTPVPFSPPTIILETTSSPRITVQETITEYLIGRRVPKLVMISPKVLMNYLRQNLPTSQKMKLAS